MKQALRYLKEGRIRDADVGKWVYELNKLHILVMVVCNGNFQTSLLEKQYNAMLLRKDTFRKPFLFVKLTSFLSVQKGCKAVKTFREYMKLHLDSLVLTLVYWR